MVSRLPILTVGFLLICACHDHPGEGVSDERPLSATSMQIRHHSALGCWHVTARDYEGYARIPSFLVFDSQPRVGTMGDTFAIVLYDSTSRGPGLGYARWVPITADSLLLAWGDGLAGVNVYLSGRDTLRGTPTDWTDLGTGRPRGELSLSRSDCSGRGFTAGWWVWLDSASGR